MHLTRADVERFVASHGVDSSLSSIQSHLQECVACQTDVTAKLEAGASNYSEAAARIKLLDPITSLGPSAPARLMQSSSEFVHLRVSRLMVVGSRVHVRSRLGNVFGRVWYCIP